MKKIKIIFEIKNKENPYFYEGIATIDNDVIRYRDEDSNVLFDMKRNILIKKEKEKMIKIDFCSKIMKIKLNRIEMNLDIEVLNINKENDSFKIGYKVDENKINLDIKILEVL